MERSRHRPTRRTDYSSRYTLMPAPFGTLCGYAPGGRTQWDRNQNSMNLKTTTVSQAKTRGLAWEAMKKRLPKFNGQRAGRSELVRSPPNVNGPRTQLEREGAEPRITPGVTLGRAQEARRIACNNSRGLAEEKRLGAGSGVRPIQFTCRGAPVYRHGDADFAALTNETEQ